MANANFTATTHEELESQFPNTNRPFAVWYYPEAERGMHWQVNNEDGHPVKEFDNQKAALMFAEEGGEWAWGALKQAQARATVAGGAASHVAELPGLLDGIESLLENQPDESSRRKIYREILMRATEQMPEPIVSVIPDQYKLNNDPFGIWQIEIDGNSAPRRWAVNDANGVCVAEVDTYALAQLMAGIMRERQQQSVLPYFDFKIKLMCDVNKAQAQIDATAALANMMEEGHDWDQSRIIYMLNDVNEKLQSVVDSLDGSNAWYTAKNEEVSHA